MHRRATVTTRVTRIVYPGLGTALPVSYYPPLSRGNARKVYAVTVTGFQTAAARRIVKRFKWFGTPLTRREARPVKRNLRDRSRMVWGTRAALSARPPVIEQEKVLGWMPGSDLEPRAGCPARRHRTSTKTLTFATASLVKRQIYRVIFNIVVPLSSSANYFELTIVILHAERKIDNVESWLKEVFFKWYTQVFNIYWWWFWMIFNIGRNMEMWN